MSKPKNIVTEYRNYYLPVDFPLLLLTGEHWKISDIPSSRLHFHNCLEIGVCHSWSGTMKFYSDPLRFKAGDVTCVPRNIPHTTWSDKGSESLWSYLYLDPQIMFRDMMPHSEGEPDLSFSSYQNVRHILPRQEFPQIYSLVMNIIRQIDKYIWMAYLVLAHIFFPIIPVKHKCRVQQMSCLIAHAFYKHFSTRFSYRYGFVGAKHPLDFIILPLIQTFSANGRGISNFYSSFWKAVKIIMSVQSFIMDAVPNLV